MSYSPSQGSVPQPADTNRYRVLCRRANGSVGLFRLCHRLGDACRIARAAVNRHLVKLRTDRLAVLMDSRRPRLVYVEKWIGTPLEGHWVVVDLDAGGYRFEFFDSPPRHRKRGNTARDTDQEGAQAWFSDSSESNGRAIRAGDIVDCMLLEKRTRKNGWFARLADHSASGPVTGSAPASTKLEPGQRIKLKLCGIKMETGFAQFAWTESQE